MNGLDTAGRLHFRYVHQARVTRLARAFAWAIPSRARTVLDVGTGDGLLAWEIAQLRPELAFTGVDVHPRPQTFIPVTIFDGEHLDMEDASVDVVTFSDVLHHTDDPLPILAEAARVARTAVVIKDHLANSRLDAAVLRAMDYAGNRHAGVSLPYNYLSSSRWQAAFDKSGLWVQRWDERPEVYGAPLCWVIGRRLHVLTVLVPDPCRS